MTERPHGPLADEADTPRSYSCGDTLVVFDPEDVRRWIQSDTTVNLADAA